MTPFTLPGFRQKTCWLLFAASVLVQGSVPTAANAAGQDMAFTVEVNPVLAGGQNVVTTYIYHPPVYVNFLGIRILVRGEFYSPVVTITNTSPITSFKIRNDSRERIVGFSVTSGAIKFDDVDNIARPTGSATPSVIEPDGSSTDVARFESITSFDYGDEIGFDAEHQHVIGPNSAQIMFNNGGDEPNSVVTVFGENGGRGELTLSDTLDNRVGRTYVFETSNRPRKLIVNSLPEVFGSGGPGFDPNLRVQITPTDGSAATDIVSEGTGTVVIEPLTDGDKVTITAVEEVYMDASSTFIYNSSDIPDFSSLANEPRERYVADGISVNNTPLTGDPTQYRFDISEDTIIDVRWRHDYALLLDHDFEQTYSEEQVAPGEYWAGPLSSHAAGNPSPDATKIHWILEGEEVLAQIDGQVLDFTRPGLDIRYVPKAYLAGGSARGVFRSNPTNLVAFAEVGQAPPPRQQVDAFVMDGWGSVQYVWQIQYGVKVNMDDLSRAALPRVYKGTFNTGFTEIGNLEGTFWLDPNDGVVIGSPANVAGPTSLALAGWVNGDGYFFSSSGDINSSDGTLTNGGPSDQGSGPVGDWLESFTAQGRTYRGLYIPALQRPARVVWTYGEQVYTYEAQLGEYLYQNDETFVSSRPDLAAVLRTEPSEIQKVTVSGNNQQVVDDEMAVWDANAKRLYPVVPGQFRAIWNTTGGSSVQVLVTALPPTLSHYPHIAGSPPVELDPDPNDSFLFKQLVYTESSAAITSDSLFTADAAGRSVLLFGEIKQIGRGEPMEFLRVRVVDTKRWDDELPNVLRPGMRNLDQPTAQMAIIGQKIADAELDLANLGTGVLLFENARYNANIYDPDTLEGLSAQNIYDMDLLRSISGQKVVVNPSALPGPVIPVNLHPGAQPNERIVVAWYYDPALTDEIMWPHAARTYLPEWPTSQADGLGRIVIASQHGNESLDAAGSDQPVLDELTVVVPDGLGGTINQVFPATTTFNPARIQEAAIYVQNTRNAPGYNPNEEHALMAPSRRFVSVSPRPPAAYALRDSDLNIFNPSLAEDDQDSNYTSHPYVLVQFFDTADQSYKMRVYDIVKEDATIPNHRFATQSLVTIPSGSTQVAASPATLNLEPRVNMEAGEPVIPFYPLGVAIGASPSPETYGENIKDQATYWEDHRGTSWAASGGDNAWFTFSIHYPLAPDFWWPQDVSGRIVFDEATTNNQAAVPFTGDSVAFLPPNINALKSIPSGVTVNTVVEYLSQPIRVLYKSDWPAVAPTLKAGETLTFSGGEFRADNPTSIVNGETVETPGLPAVLGFSVAEIVFDALNPKGSAALLDASWTARMAQVLDVRSVVLPTGSFPGALTPANGRTRVSGGKYVFNDLPASLQKRFRYDPLSQSVNSTGLVISGKLQITGLVNDKSIEEPTLTAAPPAVYALEPNILSEDDLNDLMELSDEPAWTAAVTELRAVTMNPTGLTDIGGQDPEGRYLVGLQPMVKRNPVSGKPLLVPIEVLANGEDSDVLIPDVDPTIPEPARQFGPGLAIVPNGGFLDPTGFIPNPGGTPLEVPAQSWITVAENNDPSLGSAPVTLHVIKVSRDDRYRGSVKIVLSDNVFDENVVLRHTGDFGANAEELVYEWWYRPDDGSVNLDPPFEIDPNDAGEWKLFPDPSGKRGLGRTEALLKANPNTPEILLADSWWYVRYRHMNDIANDTDWNLGQLNGDDQVNYRWAGAGNSNPLADLDFNGLPDYLPQLSSGWIKRVLDSVNPYEARIRDFEGDSPSTVSSMLQQLGARAEGAVALNPDKNVIENVGLIELYETVLNRGASLSIDLTNPVSTAPIANALQLASTRISDFYMLLANEAYTDASDPTIGFGSSSVAYGAMAPVVHSFQNQMSSLLEEELALLRGVDFGFARPVYNRLFWNFTKGEGEAAYAMNYNISDINGDGFINEDDAMILYPQGHGDAWGHYLTAVRTQYDLLTHPNFNWVSRSEFYNLQDIVIPVDFLDERKFAQIAAAKAKASTDIVTTTYREKYVEDPSAQWQGYTDVVPERAWGVEGWSRRAGQGAYFDWVVANALLPSQHPNQELEGIQKVDRQSNDDIAVVSANLNAIQQTFDDANNGLNPLRISADSVPFDMNPVDLDNLRVGRTHFEQMHGRALDALKNAVAVWDHANESQNRLRRIANTEATFRNEVYQQDLSYRNRLIKLFGRPYEGTVGPGKLYPAGFSGPDLALYMYVGVREINQNTVPGPTTSFATFDSDGILNGGDIKTSFPDLVDTPRVFEETLTDLGAAGDDMRFLYASTFYPDADTEVSSVQARDGWYSVNYTDLADPKVELENFAQLMPIKASGYTFQAPVAWGSRPSVGELQTIVNQMIRQEAEIAKAIAAWDALTGEIIRTMRVATAGRATGKIIRERTQAFERAKYIITSALKAIRAGVAISDETGLQVNNAFDATQEFIPNNLPTAGLAVSPGDALSAGRGATLLAKTTVSAGIGVVEVGLRIAELVAEIGLDVAETELGFANDATARTQGARELLKSIEDLVGDEPSLRIAIFAEIEALRGMSDKYRSLVAEGSRLIDERAAYNKRVAAMTQQNRYQDMSFRVSRNHALETYHSTLDLAARYAYLAAKAYDYETNLDGSDIASPRDLYADIVRARTPGLIVGGVPQLGQGGLAEALAWLDTNYASLNGQLGFNNPQRETGKISLRTEYFRILPSGNVQPTGNSQFPGGGQNADALWIQQLQDARVDNLWSIPQYRTYARPFASDVDASGNAVAEPGLVFRFPTKILAGQNVFGHPLSGGDHAYDASLFATKIRSVGVWFTEYISDDVLNGLPEAPRVYLFPIGSDVMSIANSPTPDMVRYWHVVDQQVPVPVPALTSALDQGNWLPLVDSLSGTLGQNRRYSSFRAYHDSGPDVSVDEMVFDSRLVGRSVWNTEWMLIIPGLTLNSDPDEGLDRFIQQVKDIKLIFETYGHSGN